jgi:hypothetical protein
MMVRRSLKHRHHLDELPMREKQQGLTRLFASVAVLLAACGTGMAREVVALNNDFRILRDFARITLTAPDVQKARVFVDTDRFVVSTLSKAENAELQQIAITGVNSKLNLVKSKEDANYLVQIRMGQEPDYAIRNQQRDYTRGFVMISLCKFPINQISEDCENLQYDYFRKRDAKEAFSTVLDMWIKATLPEE